MSSSDKLQMSDFRVTQTIKKQAGLKDITWRAKSNARTLEGMRDEYERRLAKVRGNIDKLRAHLEQLESPGDDYKRVANFMLRQHQFEVDCLVEEIGNVARFMNARKW